MLIRLNKYIAECGYCSRRMADKLIKDGKVEINGQVVGILGTMIEEEKDVIKIEGKVLKKESKLLYIMLNKPVGYITTNNEQFKRKATIDLINEDVRVFPIGRLDKDTEGLLLLTNDGEFANFMMHPRHEIEKTYIVTTNSNITNEKIESLKNGVDIGGYVTKNAKVKQLSSTKIEMIISEGKNRQIRKMCKNVNINVLGLKRVKIGNLSLGKLKVGKYRELDINELNLLKYKKVEKKLKNI